MLHGDAPKRALAPVPPRSGCVQRSVAAAAAASGEVKLLEGSVTGVRRYTADRLGDSTDWPVAVTAAGRRSGGASLSVVAAHRLPGIGPDTTNVHGKFPDLHPPSTCLTRPNDVSC